MKENDLIRLRKQLKRAITRSESAYESYLKEKKYFQALRIKKANLVLYQLLEDYLFICKDSEVQDIIEFLFHLEDWQSQFEVHEKEKFELEENFVFEKLSDSFSYPKAFTEKIKNNY